MKHFFTISLCFLALSLSAQVDCPNTFDNNSDGAVTINDLLDLLAVFGDTDTDSDGIWDSIDDCIDLTACNYANDPTEACNYIDVLGNCGGGCEGDGDDDGICDSEDDCVGVLDECGVCNGPGATEMIIESITILYDSLYAEQIDEWWVFEVGADTAFTYVCPNVFQSCGDPVSHEGYDYNTVLIGEQCWFSENCRYLPSVSPSSAFSETSPYYYVYGYEGSTVSEAKATDNYETYGVLYNWPAVMTEGICPSGWHIPTDGEFSELTDFLGEEGVAGGKAGGKMKEAGYDHWNSPNTGATNSSGWTGLPGGYRYSGGFYYNGANGIWWSASESASESGSYSWERRLLNNGDTVYRYGSSHYSGFSARCVIDYTDECGVPNGDNSTCLDDCGVPNGDNSTCLDDCGVPNGDNSTCLDDCGVPNGDNTTCLDECGVLNGDNSTCFTLFFSEYSEGSANNKYLELYNPTSSIIFLDQYALSNVSNAPSTPGTHEYWTIFPSGATVAPNSTYIIAHPSADPVILAFADMTYTYLSNGDDGYALVQGTEDDFILIDVIGQSIYDEDYLDPGTGWEISGVLNATQNHTLVRKPDVHAGNAGMWTASAGTNEFDGEWIVLEMNYWDDLGNHTIN